MITPDTAVPRVDGLIEPRSSGTRVGPGNVYRPDDSIGILMPFARAVASASS